MSAESQSERASRIALADWLRLGPSAQIAFAESLPPPLRDRVAELVPFAVEEEHLTDVDKRIDILLTSGKDAVCIELKIGHRENPFQYVMYRRYLERRGFSVTMIGILPQRGRDRGREALNTAISDWLTDYRMTWAELGAAIKCHRKGHIFVNALQKIDPVLLVDLKEPRPSRVTSADVSKVDTDPGHLAAFFGQLVSALPGCMDVYPDQAGSSPPLLRFGRSSWANWFGDADNERIYLEVDIPRRSKPLIETQFHFGVVLWSKTSSGQRSAQHVERILMAARHLESHGFTFQRNTPRKYQPVDWRPSHGLDPAGLYYLNASDCGNFCMRKSSAVRLGTSQAVSDLAAEANRIATMLDGLVATAR